MSEITKKSEYILELIAYDYSISLEENTVKEALHIGSIDSLKSRIEAEFDSSFEVDKELLTRYIGELISSGFLSGMPGDNTYVYIELTTKGEVEVERILSKKEVKKGIPEYLTKKVMPALFELGVLIISSRI